MSITVKDTEAGVLRVFALSLDRGAALKLRDDPAAQAAVLGVERLDPTHVEIFPISDIADIGLSQYLHDGNDIPMETLAPDRIKLDALDGWVMVVWSRAFRGQNATLDIDPALTLIGTYKLPGVDWSEARKLTSEAAKGSGAAADGRKTPSDAAMSGRIATLALIVLFAITGLVIWIAA